MPMRRMQAAAGLYQGTAVPCGFLGSAGNIFCRSLLPVRHVTPGLLQQALLQHPRNVSESRHGALATLATRAGGATLPEAADTSGSTATPKRRGRPKTATPAQPVGAETVAPATAAKRRGRPKSVKSSAAVAPATGTPASQPEGQLSTAPLDVQLLPTLASATPPSAAPAGAPHTRPELEDFQRNLPPPGHPAWDRRQWIVFSDLHVTDKSWEVCRQVRHELAGAPARRQSTCWRASSIHRSQARCRCWTRSWLRHGGGMPESSFLVGAPASPAVPAVQVLQCPMHHPRQASGSASLATVTSICSWTKCSIVFSVLSVISAVGCLAMSLLRGLLAPEGEG